VPCLFALDYCIALVSRLHTSTPGFSAETKDVVGVDCVIIICFGGQGALHRFVACTERNVLLLLPQGAGAGTGAAAVVGERVEITAVLLLS